MKYYLITSEEYVNHTANLTQLPAPTLDKSKYVIEVEDDYVVSEYISVFNTPNELNDWRFDSETEEWRNWIIEEDY